MKRPLLAVSLAAATALAMLAVPGAAGAKTNAPSIHGVAVKGGILNMTKVTGGRTAAAPAANWINVASMTQAVQEMGGGAATGNKVYVPGGYIEFTTPTLYDKMQVYTPSSNTWVVDSQPMPAPAEVGSTGWADAAVCADTAGKVYVVNGVDGAFLYSALQIYDTTLPLGSRWSFGPNPNIGGTNNFYSQDSGCAVISNKLYLFGGYGLTDLNPTAAIQKITWVLDLGDDTGKLMKTARFWHGYAQTTTNAYVAGGTNDITFFTPTATTEAFSPASGWASLGNMPVGRLAPGMSSILGRLIVYGGGDPSFTVLNSTVLCTLPSCTSWTAFARNLNTARWFFVYGTTSNNVSADGGGARQGRGEVSGVEPHGRDAPAVQLGDHKIRGGIVKVGDDQHRAGIGGHWSASFPVSLVRSILFDRNGRISSPLPCWMLSKPEISPASETWKNARSRRGEAHRSSSILRLMVREKLNPQAWCPRLKLRLLNGMANSALQPCSDWCVRTSQTASHSLLTWPFSMMRASTSAPSGFVAK